MLQYYNIGPICELVKLHNDMTIKVDIINLRYKHLIDNMQQA